MGIKVGDKVQMIDDVNEEGALIVRDIEDDRLTVTDALGEVGVCRTWQVEPVD